MFCGASRLLRIAVALLAALAIATAAGANPPKPRPGPVLTSPVAPKRLVVKKPKTLAAQKPPSTARPSLAGNQIKPIVRDTTPKRPPDGSTANRPNGPQVGLPTPDRPKVTPNRPSGEPPSRQPPVVLLPLPNNPPVIRPLPPRPPVTLIPLTPPPIGPGALPPFTPPPGGIPPPPAVATLPTFVPDEVLISLPLSASQTVEADVAQAFNLTIVERTEMSLVDQRLVRLRIPDRRDVPAVITALQGDARVPLVQANFYYYYQQGSALQAAAVSAGSGLQYAFGKLSLADAQRQARGGGTIVAVIDSGIERSHPDFANQPIEQLDALDLGAAAALDPHGTGVAGIIAGRGTVRGVAPDARLLSVRAFGNAQNRGTATAITSAILKGLNWSVQNGARVINMSFAGVRDPAMERNIAALPSRRVVAIAAAGNGGSKAAPAYPAAYPEVIAVTATDSADKLYERANQGGYIAVAAPGVDVLVPSGRGEHELQSGTSFAAPHVAGIVALMLELNPDLSTDHVRQLLVGAVDDLGRPGRDEQFGAGRINAAKAVAAAATFRPTLASAP